MLIIARPVLSYFLNAKNVNKMAHAKNIKNVRMVYTDHC